MLSAEDRGFILYLETACKRLSADCIFGSQNTKRMKKNVLKIFADLIRLFGKKEKKSENSRSGGPDGKSEPFPSVDTGAHCPVGGYYGAACANSVASEPSSLRCICFRHKSLPMMNCMFIHTLSFCFDGVRKTICPVISDVVFDRHIVNIIYESFPY